MTGARRMGARGARGVEPVRAARRAGADGLELGVGDGVGDDDDGRRPAPGEEGGALPHCLLCVAAGGEAHAGRGCVRRRDHHRGDRLPREVHAGELALRARADVDEREVNRRVGGREDDDVAPEGERAPVDRHAARVGRAEPSHGPELEVRAIVPRRLEAGLARPLGYPHGRAHLAERAGLAAAHGVAGEREEIAPEIALRDGGERRGRVGIGDARDCGAVARVVAARTGAAAPGQPGPRVDRAGSECGGDGERGQGRDRVGAAHEPRARGRQVRGEHARRARRGGPPRGENRIRSAIGHHPRNATGIELAHRPGRRACAAGVPRACRISYAERARVYYAPWRVGVRGPTRMYLTSVARHASAAHSSLTTPPARHAAPSPQT